MTFGLRVGGSQEVVEALASRPVVEEVRALAAACARHEVAAQADKETQRWQVSGVGCGCGAAALGVHTRARQGQARAAAFSFASLIHLPPPPWCVQAWVELQAGQLSRLASAAQVEDAQAATLAAARHAAQVAEAAGVAAARASEERAAAFARAAVEERARPLEARVGALGGRLEGVEATLGSKANQQVRSSPFAIRCHSFLFGIGRSC